MTEIEAPLGYIKRAYVYKIPPARTIKGHKAADWDIENPVNKENPFSVYVVERNKQCIIKLIDPLKNELVIECVYTPSSVEKTLDSSRYFVLIPTDERGRRAFIGLGFQERSESFDFEQAIESFKKYQDSEKEIEEMKKQWESSGHDLSLKEGEKIRININSIKGHKKEGENEEQLNNGNISFPKPPGEGMQNQNTMTNMPFPEPPGGLINNQMNENFPFTSDKNNDDFQFTNNPSNDDFFNSEWTDFKDNNNTDKNENDNDNNDWTSF